MAISPFSLAHSNIDPLLRILLPTLLSALVIKPGPPRRSMGRDRTSTASRNDATDSYEQAEYRQMSAQIKFERNHNAIGMFGQAKLAFNQKSFLKQLGLGFLVQFGNRCTGALVINNCNAQLFSGLGITGTRRSSCSASSTSSQYSAISSTASSWTASAVTASSSPAAAASWSTSPAKPPWPRASSRRVREPRRAGFRRLPHLRVRRLLLVLS